MVRRDTTHVNNPLALGAWAHSADRLTSTMRSAFCTAPWRSSALNAAARSCRRAGRWAARRRQRVLHKRIYTTAYHAVSAAKGCGAALPTGSLRKKHGERDRRGATASHARAAGRGRRACKLFLICARPAASALRGPPSRRWSPASRPHPLPRCARSPTQPHPRHPRRPRRPCHPRHRVTQFEYLWADGVKYKKPVRLSAPEYIDKLFDWVEVQVGWRHTWTRTSSVGSRTHHKQCVAGRLQFRTHQGFGGYGFTVKAFALNPEPQTL
jgi:hypothetical protein